MNAETYKPRNDETTKLLNAQTWNMQQLISLFTDHTGIGNPNLEALPSSGSNRKYYRIQRDGISLIGVHGESRDENRAFIR
ncbi:MAG: hypothetical protein PHX26_09630, partial [Proteiniphilum sp.]|nr:hypothetical protein [Proteiniphilum sp.]